MIEMLILVWAGLVVVGLFVFCGIARAGLQEDLLFTPRHPYPDSTVPLPRSSQETPHEV